MSGPSGSLPDLAAITSCIDLRRPSRSKGMPRHVQVIWRRSKGSVRKLSLAHRCLTYGTESGGDTGPPARQSEPGGRQDDDARHDEAASWDDNMAGTEFVTLCCVGAASSAVRATL